MDVRYRPESLLGTGILRCPVHDYQRMFGTGDSGISQDLIATVTISNPLPPDPVAWAKQSYDLAFPQILAFCSAAIGVVGVVYVIRAFQRG